MIFGSRKTNGCAQLRKVITVEVDLFNGRLNHEVVVKGQKKWKSAGQEPSWLQGVRVAGGRVQPALASEFHGGKKKPNMDCHKYHSHWPDEKDLTNWYSVTLLTHFMI